MAKIKTTTLLLLAGLGYLAYYLTSQGGRFDIGNPFLSAIKFEGSGIRINIKLPILNRSDLSLRITGFLGQLLFNNSVIGNISLAQPTEISAFNQNEVEFTTLLSYTGVAMEAWPILSNLINGMGLTNEEKKEMLKSFRVVGTLKFPAGAYDVETTLF